MMNKTNLSWAFYDWANSAFATTVMAGFFPIFFKEFWAADLAMTESTFRLGAANSIASLVIVVLAPVLGAIADQGSARKRFLLFFAVMGIVMTGMLPLVAHGHWAAALVLYVLALIGFTGGNIFYDALLPVVSSAKHYDRISALGYALGYLGGGLLFSLNVAMTLWPSAFGIADAAMAVRISFVLVAIWWAVFSIPVFLFVKEPVTTKERGSLTIIRDGLRQLRDTFREIRALRTVFIFLIAYWLYIDGVDTIIRMAVDYGLSLGFDSKSLIVALLITQFVGFPAALVFGRIGDRIGAKTGILIGIAIYIGITIFAFFMDQVIEFYVLAVAVGLVQGGIQALSRSMYARMIPQDKAAEFFGFYNMLGKFAAVIGPLMVGWVGLLTGEVRYGILSVIILFVAGGLVLMKVDTRHL